VTGDERQFEADDEARVQGELNGMALDEQGPETVAQVFREHHKDTNPKDGVGSLKPSYAAVPVPVLYELGAALAEGARKYGGYNWRVAGVRASVYIDATRRHLDAWWGGETIDPESGHPHLAHAGCCLLFLIWFDGYR